MTYYGQGCWNLQKAYKRITHFNQACKIINPHWLKCDFWGHSYEIAANTHGFDNCKLLLSCCSGKRELSGKFNQMPRYLVKTFLCKDFHWGEVAKNLLLSFAICNWPDLRWWFHFLKKKVHFLNLYLLTSNKQEN